jgi:uncharacterized protein (TIGR03437 family)
MKIGAIPALLFSIAAAAPLASATIATLGLSNQTYTLTGIGANASGLGQSNVKWGTCAFDGTNTNCTLSGTFTGFAGGGNYSFVLSYPGTGAFPLIAVAQAPGSNLITFQAKSTFSLVVTLAETSGPTLTFYSFANFDFLFASPTCTGVSSCAVGQVGLTSGATITGQVNGTFDPTPFIEPGGVVTATAYGAFTAGAPATWLEIYGLNLATNTTYRAWAAADFNGIQAPTSLAAGGVMGTSVTIAGLNAYVYFISPGQVDVQVPSGVPAGTQPLVLTTAGGSSIIYNVTINALEAGLLSPVAFNLKNGQNIAAQFSGTSTFVLPVAVTGITTQRCKPGDYLTLYGVGFGGVSPNILAGQIVQQQNSLQAGFNISFAGVPATILYAGLAPGYVGLYQINIQVPNVAASDSVPVTFSLGGSPGLQTNLVIAVQ